MAWSAPPNGYSSNVSAANGLFTLLGFMGLYALLSIFYLFLVQRQIDAGPESQHIETTFGPVTGSA